jgi:hypothetical protein
MQAHIKIRMEFVSYPFLPSMTSTLVLLFLWHFFVNLHHLMFPEDKSGIHFWKTNKWIILYESYDCKCCPNSYFTEKNYQAALVPSMPNQNSYTETWTYTQVKIYSNIPEQHSMLCWIISQSPYLAQTESCHLDLKYSYPKVQLQHTTNLIRVGLAFL